MEYGCCYDRILCIKGYIDKPIKGKMITVEQARKNVSAFLSAKKTIDILCSKVNEASQEGREVLAVVIPNSPERNIILNAFRDAGYIVDITTKDELVHIRW